MAVAEPAQEESSSPYELFIAAVSILSLFNIALLILPVQDTTKAVVLVVDVALGFVLLGDFFQRLLRTQPHSDYFIRRLGWLDLLGSMPVPGLRVFRLIRLLRIVASLRRRGGRRVLREIDTGRAETALLGVVFMVFVTVEFASIAILDIETRAAGANILNASDALWWSMVTIATVGYGDKYPVSNGGRVVGVLLMIIGVTLFGTFTAFIANFFLVPRRRQARADELGELRALAERNERMAIELRERLDRLDSTSRRPG